MNIYSSSFTVEGDFFRAFRAFCLVASMFLFRFYSFYIALRILRPSVVAPEVKRIRVAMTRSKGGLRGVGKGAGARGGLGGEEGNER